MGAGGDKTEKATPKKRRDARKKGQVLKSTEVSTAFCCVVMFATLLLIWPSFTDQMITIFKDYLGMQSMAPATGGVISGADMQNLYTRVLITLLSMTAPLLGAALLAGIIANIAQVGFLFTTESMRPKFNRISPISGFKRLFSSRTLVELLKSLIKVIVLGYVIYGEYMNVAEYAPLLLGRDLYDTFLHIMNTVFSIALKLSVVLAIIAAADYLFQWWKYERDLRMSKQEIKDEYKMTEGDPQIKGKIRQKQRQMSAMRMMSRVPDADVVITNPTHYAVALRYTADRDGAPVVVAKGQDYLARKIKELAVENGIEIVENKPLAQALYAMCEVDMEIPEEFYQAVADILVFVYRQKKRGGSAVR